MVVVPVVVVVVVVVVVLVVIVFEMMIRRKRIEIYQDIAQKNRAEEEVAHSTNGHYCLNLFQLIIIIFNTNNCKERYF